MTGLIRRWVAVPLWQRVLAALAMRVDVPYPVLLAAYLLLCVGWYLLTRKPERAVALCRQVRGERGAALVTRAPD